eukprot:CAMPEP_0171099852 /NCGR_PEP_ID=MMETSP0766_2-20121228/52607_1 /TAXON_ID=439317 /ORGANISM="Gambierdiscus australes, Strain CAWD 149" /LENGTH=220 /DNA_ID=CAMNT_0011559575 /DNA_START=430 /DNA_END=1093 /DNA_ORIENTATION=-
MTVHKHVFANATVRYEEAEPFLLVPDLHSATHQGARDLRTPSGPLDCSARATTVGTASAATIGAPGWAATSNAVAAAAHAATGKARSIAVSTLSTGDATFAPDGSQAPGDCVLVPLWVPLSLVAYSGTLQQALAILQGTPVHKDVTPAIERRDEAEALLVNPVLHSTANMLPLACTPLHMVAPTTPAAAAGVVVPSWTSAPTLPASSMPGLSPMLSLTPV